MIHIPLVWLAVRGPTGGQEQPDLPVVTVVEVVLAPIVQMARVGRVSRPIYVRSDWSY